AGAGALDQAYCRVQHRGHRRESLRPIIHPHSSRTTMPSQHKRYPNERTASGASQPEQPATSEAPAETLKIGQPGRPGEGLKITDLKDLSIQRLTQIAKDMNVSGATGMRKQELIFQILKTQTELSGF